MEELGNKKSQSNAQCDGGDSHFGYDDHRREYYDHVGEAGPRASSRFRDSTADDEGNSMKEGHRRQKEKEDQTGALTKKPKKKRKALTGVENGATETGVSDCEKEHHSNVTPSPLFSSAARADRSRKSDDYDEEDQDNGDAHAHAHTHAGGGTSPSLLSTSGRKEPRLLFPPSHRRRRSSSSRPQHCSRVKEKKEKKKVERVLARSFSDSFLSSDIPRDSAAVVATPTSKTNDVESQYRAKDAKKSDSSSKKSTSSRSEKRYRQRWHLGAMDSLAIILPPQKKQRQRPSLSTLSRANHPDEADFSSPRPTLSAGKRGPGRPRINYANNQKYVSIPRRGPGRPRKYPVVESKRVENQDNDHLEFTPRRGRGRPRKNQEKLITKSTKNIGSSIHASSVNNIPVVNDSNWKNNNCSDIPSDLLPLFDRPTPNTGGKPRSAEQILEDTNRQQLAVESRRRRSKLPWSATRSRGGKNGLYISSQRLDRDHENDETSSHSIASTISRPRLERACKTKRSINYNEESDEDGTSKRAYEDNFLNGMEDGNDRKTHGNHSKSPAAPNSYSHIRSIDGEHDSLTALPSKKEKGHTRKTRSAFDGMTNPFAASQYRSSDSNSFGKSRLTSDICADSSRLSAKNRCNESQEHHRVKKYSSERHCEGSIAVENDNDVRALGLDQQHPTKRGGELHTWQRDDIVISSNSRQPSKKKRVRFEITKPDGTRIKFRCDGGGDSTSNAAVQAAIAVLAGTSSSENFTSMSRLSEEYSHNKGEVNDKAITRGNDASLSDSCHFNADSHDVRETGNCDNSYQRRHALSQVTNGESCSVISELTHHWNADARSRKRKLVDTHAELEDDGYDFGDMVTNSNTDFVVFDKNKSSDGPFSRSRSHKRDGRRWSCMDSLAGSYANFEKKHTSAGKKTSRKSHLCLPKHVSVPSKRKYINSSKTHQDKKHHLPDKEQSCAALTREASPANAPRRMKGLLTARSTKYTCGTCPGCTLTIDCQTCKPCLVQLRNQIIGTNCNKDREHSRCIKRRCHRARRFASFDSLMSLASNNSLAKTKDDCADILTNKGARKDGSQEHCDDHRWEPNEKGKSEIEMGDGAQPKPKSNKEVTSRSLEDNDDWSVDYSYLSEPEYRNKWRFQQQLQRQRLSRSQSVSSRNRFEGRAMGTVASLSTISASVRPKWHSSIIDRQLAGFNEGKSPKQGPGRPRGQMRKKTNLKNPLHGLEIPSGSSISIAASLHESRESLRALMEYDETDQEWV